MKISQIINLDCTKKENKVILSESLLRLPFFKNKSVEDITTEDLEIAMNKISMKYPIKLGYIMTHGVGTNDVYHHTFMIKDAETHNHLTTLFALTLFEGMAKTVLYLYAYVKTNFIGGKK